MKGMTERQYAAHAGISRGAVQKARAAGRLALFPDGSIDAAGSDARRARATDPANYANWNDSDIDLCVRLHNRPNLPSDSEPRQRQRH